MNSLVQLFGTLIDLLIVIVGFGLLIFIHELGHFLAARWAGIRVLAFAIGFGPAICSYRKGSGLRRGSAEDDEARTPGGPPSPEQRPKVTEYRLNAIPLGGYVKMLGQEDLNPEAVSSAADSYQSAPVWKRMIVISAGVVANMIGAAILFIAVFTAGLQSEPPIVGRVLPDSPAASAVAVNAREAGAEKAGLQPGDRIISIGGSEPQTFNDVNLRVALAEAGKLLPVAVQREGLEEPLRFRIEPEPSRMTQGLLSLGFEPARSLQILAPSGERGIQSAREALERSGLSGVEPGATVVSASGNTDPRGAADIVDAFAGSGGEPVELVFEQPGGSRVSVSVSPQPQLQQSRVQYGEGAALSFEHVLGLTPVMRVADETDPAQGLAPGDVFAVLGAVEYPSLPAGIAEIRARAGEPIEVVVLRETDEGTRTRVKLDARVKRNGQIGFIPDDTAAISTLLSKPPEQIRPIRAGAEPRTPAAADVIERPGTRLRAIDGEPVETLFEVREALRAKAADGEGPFTVLLTLELPLETAEGEPAVVDRTWELDAEARRHLLELAWSPPFTVALFEPRQMTLKAESPIGAVGLGLHETKRILVSTYVQIARMFEGSVRIEHIKGPVGIAHIGTRIADRGLVWLTFFFALISVNLAVINFLPLPIVDGGQFLMLVYEQIRGKPVPIEVQNAITTAGLLLIVSVFLIVTFNDVRALLGI